VIILDLALQGIRDLSGSVRVRLQSGYNAMVCPVVDPRTVMIGLCELLFAHGYDPTTAKLVAPESKSSGGGVTLMAADGATFRVMRDLAAGSAQLLEFVRETKSFSRVTSDPSEITQFLRSRVGLSGRRIFESVFIVEARDLPSYEPVAEVNTEEEFEPRGPDPQELRKRLAEIDAALAEQQAIEKLEFELDGLQKQRFNIEDQLGELTFDRSELDEAQAQLSRIAYLDAMPEGFLPRYQAYRVLVERREADVKRWETERGAIEREARAAQVEPLLRDWRLWTGLGVGVLSVACAAAVGGVLRWAALLDIPAFGLVAVVLFQSLTQREARDRASRKMRLSDERRAKILDRDADEVRAVEAILREVGLETPGEVERALAMRGQVRARLAELSAAERAAAEDPRLAELRTKRDEIGARITELENRLATSGAMPVDVLALRSEADHLRAQLDSLDEPETEPEVSVEPVVRPMGEAWHKGALDLMLTDPESAATILSERASLLLRALSDNRLVDVVIDARGSVALRSAQAREPFAWDAMPVAARDLAYLALRGGLFLAVDQRVRSSMILEDLGGRLANGLAIVQTLCTTLSHGGQVIHLVRRPEQAPGAKHVASAEARA
jgi:hypothetical protein